MLRSLLLVVAASAWLGLAAQAAVPDPQIMTDHPVYRGELSCSTLDRNIADAYRVYKDRYGHTPTTETEKLTALWIWKCEHYMHVCDNKVYVGPDSLESEGNGWMDCRDYELGQFSFGFGLCYSVHAQMSALVARALGGDITRVRCPTTVGHTPFEAFVDGHWVLADFTTGMMVFDDDGRAVGIQEILQHVDANDEAWLTSPKRGGPYKIALGPAGHTLRGYKNELHEQMLFGYSAMPIVYTLRSGEDFTRYLEPGLADGKTWVFWGRDYFSIGGGPKHGPWRDATFLDDYPVGNGKKGRGNGYYGNGVFEYRPSLADGKYKEGVKTENQTIYEAGALRGLTQEAFITFEHVSPYVIAARSVEGGDREWKLLEEKCADGAIVSGISAGKVPVRVSVDGGHTWEDIGTVDGKFKKDFTDIVKGRHTYQVRFGLSPESGLKALRFHTVTQISRAVFPRLKDGGTTVTYQGSSQGAIHGGPSQYLAEPLRRKDLETDGVRVYQVVAPGPIRSATGVLRASGPGLGPWSVEFSVDGGKTWKSGVKDVTLKEGASEWGNGKHAYAWSEMTFPDNQGKDVLIRMGKGHLYHCQVFATYQANNSSPLVVTYGWQEGSRPRTNTHSVALGKEADTWAIPTGQDIKAQWVKFSAP
jgi:hypothetical protein